MRGARALACPASLKGVLHAQAAASALAEGFRRAGVEAEEVPVADGGEGTAAVLEATLGGEWREARVADPLGRPVEARWLRLPDGTAVVESAAALGLPLLAPEERDPLAASSRGLGQLVRAALGTRPSALLVALGGVATVDGGAGLLAELPTLGGVPTVAACDVRAPLLGPRGAARAFGPQKGATPEGVEELERRLASRPDLAPWAELPGAGAAGGLGAALASLGAELVGGAELVLMRIDFGRRLRGAALAVTGEGTVDATTAEGKAPAAVAAACRAEGVRCVVFGGRVERGLPGAETVPLSGRPESARADLVLLGERLGSTIVSR